MCNIWGTFSVIYRRITILFCAKRQEPPRADSTKHSKPKTLETNDFVCSSFVFFCLQKWPFVGVIVVIVIVVDVSVVVFVVVVVVVVVGKRWSPEPPHL